MNNGMHYYNIKRNNYGEGKTNKKIKRPVQKKQHDFQHSSLEYARADSGASRGTENVSVNY